MPEKAFTVTKPYDIVAAHRCTNLDRPDKAFKPAMSDSSTTLRLTRKVAPEAMSHPAAATGAAKVIMRTADLLRHSEIDAAVAATICQQHEREAREGLRRLETRYQILESHRRGKEMIWRLRPDCERRLVSDTAQTRSRESQTEAAMSTIQRALRDRHERRMPGLSNAEIRTLTSFDREQVKYMMRKMKQGGLAEADGRGAGARWRYVGVT